MEVMKMDKKQLAKSCVSFIGGKQNIQSAAHCFTRLRFTLKDQKQVDVQKLKDLNGVLDVQEVGTQTQIIIGPGVEEVYREVKNLLGDLQGQTKTAEPKGKKNFIPKLFDTVTGIFGPIIPIITAAGMVKAVLAILVLVGLSKDSQEYYIINFISDASFYFFPIFLGFSSGNKFGCNPYLAAVLGGVLLHPNFVEMLTAGDPVSFFGMPVVLYKYASSVLPIILIAFFMSYVQRFAEKISPNFIKAILVPLLVIGISAPVGILIIGPIGSLLGEGLATCVSYLDNNIPFLVPTLMGAFCPLLVFVGMHNALTPLASISLVDKGFETIQGPGMLASNIAQAAASLAVGLKSKNQKTKQLAFSAGATALCGITEPALYGVTFKYKRPLIAVMIGGGLGGLYAGLTHLVRFSFGSPGIPTLPVFIGEDPANFRNAVITLLISFVVTFILTWILGFEEEKESDGPEYVETSEALTEHIMMEKIEIQSPLQGQVLSLSAVNDQTFASEAIGKGVAIVPENNTIFAPCDGFIITVFKTKHAIGIMSSGGTEILLHLGIDTVELNGKYFDINVKNGDKIHKGQVLGTMDLDGIKGEGYDITSPVIITNSKQYVEVIGTKKTNVTEADSLLTIF